MIGQILKKLRSNKGFSQRKLAALIGVDQSFIAHIENGARDPGYDTLQKWLEVCGGRLVILDTGEVPDGLPPEETRLLRAVRQLDPADLERITELSELLPRVDALTRELLRSQIDGPLGLLRKSASIDRASRIVG